MTLSPKEKAVELICFFADTNEYGYSVKAGQKGAIRCINEIINSEPTTKPILRFNRRRTNYKRMKKEQFKTAKELSEKIDLFESKVRQIELLLKSCGLSCEFSGTPAGRFSMAIPYVSFNKDAIRSLLEADKLLYLEEIDVLKKQFDEL